MTAHSLRVDLPYRVPPDELELETTTETQAELDATTPTAGETTLQAEPLAITETQPAPAVEPPNNGQAIADDDAAFLARQLYEVLVKQHGTESLAAKVDNDVLQLLSRYRSIDMAVTTVEYYSNAGTFFLESIFEGPHDTSLYAVVSQLQALQKQGNLPGLQRGMHWWGGYIRLSAPGCRPVLLRPNQTEANAATE